MLNVCIGRTMKQVVLITLLVVTLASYTCAEEETKLEESDRYNDRIIKGISYEFFEHGPEQSRPIVTPNKLREKRSEPLKYNRDGTISLKCRFSPASCRNGGSTTRGRRTRRGGKRLLSLYLKPAAQWGSSIGNLRKSVYGERSSPKTKGKRLISLSLKSPRPTPQPRLPNNVYTRAFTRFTDDVTRTRSNQRIARPRPRAAVRPRPRAVRPRRVRRPHRVGRSPARPRPRPRSTPRRRKGKGKEVFSLYLKPPALKPRFIPGGRFAPPRSEDVPLICKFQPKRCGSKGKKIFSLHYKGFKTLFPYAFPLL